MMIKHGTKIIIAGGYIRSVITGERISDVDVFAGDKTASEILATELQGNSSFYKSDNAFTVRGLALPVQFIFRWVFDNPISVMESFDFTICQSAFWYDSEKKKWDSVCSERFYQDVASRRIIYLSPIRNEDAGGSILRVLKYYQRGYRIPLDSLAAIMARLYAAIDIEKASENGRVAVVIAGLLYEVDPAGQIDHEAYLPSEESIEEI